MNFSVDIDIEKIKSDLLNDIQKKAEAKISGEMEWLIKGAITKEVISYVDLEIKPFVAAYLKDHSESIKQKVIAEVHTIYTHKIRDALEDII